MIEHIYILGLAWNLIVLLLFGEDKRRSKHKERRVPEIVLIASAILFGGLGAMFGMVLFNHKTAKFRFRVLISLAALLDIAMICILNIGLVQ